MEGQPLRGNTGRIQAYRARRTSSDLYPLLCRRFPDGRMGHILGGDGHKRTLQEDLINLEGR